MGKIELYYSYRVQKGDTLELIIQQFKKKALPLAHMERCIIDSNLNVQQVWNDEANKSPGYICHKGFSKREGKNDQDCRVYPGEWVALPYEGFLYTPVPSSQRSETEHANTAPALWVHEKQEIKIVPIMFLPGIMGTRLKNEDSGETIWDPDNKKMMFFLSFKGLKIKQKLLGITNAPEAVPITEPAKNLFGKSKPYTTEQLDRNYAAIASGFYDRFLRALETKLNTEQSQIIYPVYVCAYDWRKDINDIAAKDVKNVYDKIKEEQETDEMIIITHSMGGLVAREFLRQNPQAAQKIKAVIHGVQPVQGAVQFYAYFKCGARHFSPWWDIPGTILGNILGASKKDFAALCSDIPGALELAPTVNSKEKQWLDWDEKLEQTYDIRAQKQDIFSCYEDTSGILGFTDKSFNPTVNKLITDNINLSKAFHKKLELYCHDRTYVLSSSLVKTVQSVHIKPNNITVDLATDFCCGEPKAM
ncbi:MAG: esterase/lipase family protein, partial [Treponema lecithinolyticum]|uniref:esterase/lipase family protein n=1 Tax=Treponema lecithinolyticum TaxID=53418 RepID=UPI003FA3315E